MGLMVANFRNFAAGPDAFGRTWHVEYLWHQNGIAIRHSDTVDVKFMLSCGDTRVDKVIALRHTDLLELSRQAGRPVTDAWSIRLAALHLKHMIETGEDVEKTLVTPPLAALEAHAGELGRAERR